MTYNEALNFNQKWTPIQAFNDLERYLLREEKPAMKAVAIGMKALEKQIPKKGKNKNQFTDICVSCGHSIYPHMKYCVECGQALDWNE